MPEIPEKPWQVVSVDFGGPYPDGHYNLVVIDKRTRYPEVESVHSTAAKPTKEKLKKIFATYGTPEQLLAVGCNICQRWTHVDCTGFMTKSFYDKLVKEELEYNFTCNGCINKDLPFFDNSDFISQSEEQASTNTKLPSTADPDHFQCFIQKGLHFLHLNARLLLPKITELKIIAAKSRAAVISFTETWLDDSD